MKKIKISRPRKIVILSVAVALGFVGLTAYEINELKNLRSRVGTIESKDREAEAFQAEQEEAYENEKINYEIISKSEQEVRVEKAEPYYKDASSTAISYEAKKMIVYKVKVTNSTTWDYDYSEGVIRGKTSSGSLVAPQSWYQIHPDDRQGAETLSLAPGGVGEVYIYLPYSEDITDLHFSDDYSSV